MRVILLLLTSILLLSKPVMAEEVDSEPDLTENSGYDAYYNAMLRSINLDRSRWKSISNSFVSGPWFYDTQSIRRKGGVVSVQITAYPNPSRTDLYGSVFNDHSKIRRMVFVTQVDCGKRQYRQPQISAYGYDEQLLVTHSIDSRKQKYSPIKTDSTIDTLRRHVCEKNRVKR